MWEFRLAKAVATAILAALALTSAYNGVVDFAASSEWMRHVFSFDQLRRPNGVMGRAITDTGVINAFHIVSIGLQALAGLCFLAGAAAMLSHLRGPIGRFVTAKRWLPLGAIFGFLVWFLGWMVIGGQYFVGWQTPAWDPQDSAFRLYMTMIGVLVFVSLPEPIVEIAPPPPSLTDRFGFRRTRVPPPATTPDPAP